MLSRTMVYVTVFSRHAPIIITLYNYRIYAPLSFSPRRMTIQMHLDAFLGNATYSIVYIAHSQIVYAVLYMRPCIQLWYSACTQACPDQLAQQVLSFDQDRLVRLPILETTNMQDYYRQSMHQSFFIWKPKILYSSYRVGTHMRGI